MLLFESELAKKTQCWVKSARPAARAFPSTPSKLESDNKRELFDTRVSLSGGTPKSSILIGFFMVFHINHRFEVPLFWKPPYWIDPNSDRQIIRIQRMTNWQSLDHESKWSMIASIAKASGNKHPICSFESSLQVFSTANASRATQKGSSLSQHCPRQRS